MEPVSDPALLDQLNAKPVTDPALLAQLNGGAPSSGKPVTDPALLDQLNSPQPSRAQPGTLSFALQGAGAGPEAVIRMIAGMAGTGAGALGAGVAAIPDVLRGNIDQAAEGIRSGMEEGAQKMTPNKTVFAPTGMIEKAVAPMFEKLREAMARGGEMVAAPNQNRDTEKAGRIPFLQARKTPPAEAAAMRGQRQQIGRTMGEYAFDAPAAAAPFSMLRGGARPRPVIEGESTRIQEPDLSTGLSTAFEGMQPPPSPTGTSSGVPLKMDKLIAEAQRLGVEGLPIPPKALVRGAAEEGKLPPQQGATKLDQLAEQARVGAENLQPPPIRGLIRQAAQEGQLPPEAAPTPVFGSGKGLPKPPKPEDYGGMVPTRPGIEQTIESAKGDISTPPEAPQARGEAPMQPVEPSGASFTPFNVDKDYGAPPLAIPDSEVRGSRSGGVDRKVYEIVHFNTPFERVLADSGRNWKTEQAQENARERLNAAVRQMSDADAERFGAFKDMTPEQATEAAKQYFDQIRSQLFAARKTKPAANAIQIEAPDAERALLRKSEPPVAPEASRTAGEIPAPPEAAPVEPAAPKPRIKLKPGAGTLSANPMLDPGAIKDFLDKAIKKGFGWANAIQSAPESAKGAIAPLIEYARKVQAAKEIAQRDTIKPEERAAGIQSDHAKALDAVFRANPRFQYRRPTTLKEMAAETERMERTAAAAVMRRKLREGGYAIKGHDAAPDKGDVFREPKLNMTDLKDETGRPLRVREDVQDLVDQVVGAHDIGEQRRYNKSFWGKLEAVNHATVGWLMQNPIFHMVTTAGKAAVYTLPTPTRSSLASYWNTATEAINNRATLRDWVEHGLQPFPMRGKMEITGAKPGVIESLFDKSKTAKGAYEAYQAFHNRILADVVNKIQMSFAQMRLEQLVKQEQARGGTMTPEKLDAFKTTAAQESNPVGGNLPREELNRTLYRVTGNLFFSRGLQVSTTRFLTRTVENNEIVRAYAESKGFSPKDAQILTDRNRNFLMTALALDYLLMQTVANGINYATTAMYDQPDKDGNKGGHFTWENPGAKPEDKLFPTRIFLYPKTGEDGKPSGEGVYISNPIRTVRDIIEYAMVPFQIGSGTKPKILENKSSVTAKFAKALMTGSDWAGRPLSGPGDVVAETGSMLMPSPAGDLPRYALESYRSGNTSFLAEGLKKIFDPEIAIPVLLGLQPSVSSKSPDVTMKAGEVSKDQAKVWARASRTKQLMKGMDAETRDTQINSVLDDAEKSGMDARSIKMISRFMQNEDVSKAQQRKAETYDMLHAPTDELAPPPKELEKVD